MFEKLAEEYTLQKLVGLEDFDSYQSAYYRYENGVQDAFKDGAEFGYKKCQEEMQKNGLALQSDMDETIKQNIALKKMIEKMKCCGNCGKWENCEKDEMFSQDICGDWELER